MFCYAFLEFLFLINIGRYIGRYIYLYRSGSNVCVCVRARDYVSAVLHAFIFWLLRVSIFTKHWLSDSLSPTADRALRKDLSQVTGNTRTRLRGLRELWAETLTIALPDQEEKKPLGRPSGLNPVPGQTAPDRGQTAPDQGQTPDEPGVCVCVCER